MMFRRDAALVWSRDTRALPYASLLARFAALAFEPARCRAELARLPEPVRALFRRDAFLDGGALIRDEVLFGGDPELTLAAYRKGSAGGARTVALEIPDDAVPAIGEFVRAGQRAGDVEELRARYADLGPDFLDVVLADAAYARAPWPRGEGPHIQRREHASLVIRSRSTSLLLDPLGPLVDLPGLGALPADHAEHDAVLISHGHGDHLDIPALLGRLAPSTPVYVPEVPRTSVLSALDGARELAAAGQRVAAAPWGSTLRVGDIEVDVLPFYGEQPSRDCAPVHPDLRNWGNCYRITTPELSLFVLVDAGRDARGSMLEVARASRAQRGPVDVVVSCLREFPSPFFGGLAQEWMALSADDLTGLFAAQRAGTLPFTTAGIAGLVPVLAALEARFYLPYAHGFAGLNAPIADIGWGEGERSEREALTELARALRRQPGCSTQVVSWLPGDLLRVSARGAHVESNLAARP